MDLGISEQGALAQSEFEDISKNTMMFADILTYDVYFEDDGNSNRKGFKEPLDSCKSYIKVNNSTNNSYSADYKGGVVSVRCNETEGIIYWEEVK
jgi:hypothetical protein